MKKRRTPYGIIKDAINHVYPLNSEEGVFVSDHLWTLPNNWIEGLAKFVIESDGAHPGWIAAQLLHDIGGFVNKQSCFVPRCFKGGNVWDGAKKVKS